MDESGATAVEYGIMVALIAAVVVAVVFVLGQQTKSLFQKTSDSLNAGSGTVVTTPGKSKGKGP